MAMTIASTPIDDGQFEDAPVSLHGIRTPHAYIDTYDPKSDNDDLNWSDSSKDEEEIDETYDDNRVEDEDWENAERGRFYFQKLFPSLFPDRIYLDFTKQYNRLRQHVAVRTGNAQGISKAHNQSVTVASLPAVNHPRSATISSSSNPLSKSATSLGKDRTSDQLAALAKYNSRLAKIDVPYIMGVGVNRKGPSAHANLKDKADRATNEQVLDPRTRLILFKMIGRGLIHEVNGCVSTGKEVRFQLHFQR
jgi:RIO kinase 1